MRPRTRAFANHAPSTNRPGAGRVAAAQLEEWAKQALPNAVRVLLAMPYREAIGKLATLPDNVKRSQILAEVETQVGKETRERMRRDTFALLQGMRVPL
jgi:hypothetical protein